MASLAVLGQKQIVGLGVRNYVITQVYHDGGSNTVTLDQTASVVRVFPLDGQTAPTVSLGTADSSTFLQTVTLSGGTAGNVDLVTAHGAAVASVKA